MSSNNNCNKITEDAKGNEDVGQLLNDYKQDDIAQYKTLKLDPQQEDFFKKDQQTSDKKYPRLSKLLSILRVTHSGIEAILKLFVAGLEVDKDGKKTKDTVEDMHKTLADLRKNVFRNSWQNATNGELRHAFKRFLEFSRERFLSDNTILRMKDLLFIMAILKVLLGYLITKIEKGKDDELQLYEAWLGIVADAIDKVLNSNAFRGVAISAASAGVFVVGANAGLAALGFTAAGVQAGSIAAAWMSSIGSVSGGSLFAMLQSAGVIGFGFAATGGIALVGVGVGVLIHLATRVTECSVPVYIERQGVLDADPEQVQFNSNTTLSQLLCQYIPVDVPIKAGVDAIVIDLYDPLLNRRQKLSLRDSDLEARAKFIINSKALILSKKPAEATSSKVPYYLKRDDDLWIVTRNEVQADW